MKGFAVSNSMCQGAIKKQKMGRKTYMFNESVSLLLSAIKKTTVGQKLKMIEVKQMLSLFGDGRKL